MISKIRDSFRRDFARLPKEVQQQARDAYRRLHAILPIHRSHSNV